MNTKQIKEKFESVDKESWWGDHLDVRFELMNTFKEIKNKVVLEVGCNNGVALSEIEENNEAHGFDVSYQYVIGAKKVAKKSKLLAATMYNLPYKTNFFDVIVWSHVVPGSDFYEPENKKQALRKQAIAETRRVLKKEGVLFLTTPNQARYHSNKMSHKDLVNLLERFKDVQIYGWNPFPNYPYFIPARILANIPGVFELLGRMMHRNILMSRCKGFFVTAKK